MKKKRFLRIVAIVLAGILALWLILTFYVQLEGEARFSWLGPEQSDHFAVIVYDPDPFYNLDEQVAEALARGLVQSDWKVYITTTRSYRNNTLDVPELAILIANTYNWAPDKNIMNFLSGVSWPENQEVVAITLGSGSTGRSQRLLEEGVVEKGYTLLSSHAFWLLRPNDETRLERSNVEVACEMVQRLGEKISLERKKN